MKKYIVILASMILAFILLSCGREPEVITENMFPDEELAEEAKDRVVIGFSQIGSESDWRVANTESYLQTFTEANGYYLLYEDGQQKQENQIKAVRNFILMGVDYIILSPIVETGWDGVLQEAKDAGVPVIFVDRQAEVDSNLYTCWVGTNSLEEGRIAGRWLERYLEREQRSDEEINIVTIQGTLESSVQIGRSDGFDQIMRKNRNWNMLAKESGDFTQAKGKEVMESFLKEYGDIDVVVCENDNMAFGAIVAIKEAGKTCGPDGDIIIISFDAVYAAFEAMVRGDMNVSIECNPLYGEKVREVIEQLERGEIPEKTIYIESGIYPAETAEEYLDSRLY